MTCGQKSGWKCLLAGLWLPLALSLAARGQDLHPYSPEAQALIQRAFQGLEDAPVMDAHVHIVGTGSGGTGCEIDPLMLDWRHPLKRTVSSLYISAAGVRDFRHFDAQYVERLLSLARDFGHPIRLHILAMDHAYTADGKIDSSRSEFYVPNEYVVALAKAHPEVFIPVISVHPARPDAISELERWADQGVRWVKWLPNAQNIDPADPRHDAFYLCMKRHGMTLLTHTGEEKAVNVSGAQALGNPLKLRRPLDLGLTVVAAHCASLGTNEDLDHPGLQRANFDLFLRLLAEPKYQGHLYGDISAMTQFNRMPGPLCSLLARPELQDRLINGSDYPLPAMNCVIWLGKAVKARLITKAQRKGLKEIFRRNPLLFDFVLKRVLTDPVSGKALAATIFAERLLQP